jgi:hypothetical protein
MKQKSLSTVRYAKRRAQIAASLAMGGNRAGAEETLSFWLAAE